MFTNADLIASKQPTFEDGLISRYINENGKSYYQPRITSKIQILWNQP